MNSGKQQTKTRETKIGTLNTPIRGRTLNIDVYKEHQHRYDRQSVEVRHSIYIETQKRRTNKMNTTKKHKTSNTIYIHNQI